MKENVTNAADITILRTIDNTLKAGGGPISVGATAVMASKGKPFAVTRTVAATVEKLFGRPLPKKAVGAEGLRHLAPVLKAAQYCNVVRVVAADYRFPSISFATADGAAATAANAYDTTLSIGTGKFLQVWPVDGDPSVNRSVEILNVVTDKGAWAAGVYAVNDVVSVTGGRLICLAPTLEGDTAPTLAAPTAKWKVYRGEFDQRVTLNFYDKDKNGSEYLLESYLVGFDPEDKDDMGAPAFIETVLEQQNSRFRANFDETLSWSEVLAGLKGIGKTAFAGGTNGGEPETADWIKGWDLFRNETFAAKHLFAAGNHDPDVLANLLDIADKRRSAAYFDAPPTLTSAQAIAWLKGTGLNSRNARVTHCPFSANDPTYGGAMVWGASGDKVAAKCRCEAIFSGATPGVHFSAAGTNRAMMDRTGMKPLHPEDVLDKDALYDARINPVVAGDTGGAVIDDDLALHFREDYSRFAWVVDIDNYIAHQFLQMAAALKHEPDGLTSTGLTKGMRSIMDPLVTSGALVKPRDPQQDGTKEYVVTVQQLEIDLWSVTWDFCPTGSARRIVGQPRLIK